jgi:hypothetical protein
VIERRDRSYVMSKTEALKIADRLRTEIREGTRTPTGVVAETTTAPAMLSFTDIANAYLERHVRVPARRQAAAQSIANYVHMLKRLEIPIGDGRHGALGTRPFATLTKADLEAVRDARRVELAHASEQSRIRAGCKGGEVGIEHLMATARQLWNWAIREGTW